MEQTTDDTRSLRRCVRESAALSVLSAAWGRTEPQGIADSLAEVLLRSLPHVDFVYARVKALSDDGFLEAVHTSQPLEPVSRSQEIKKALEPPLKNSNFDQSSVIPNPLGADNVRLAIIPIGYEGDCGVLVAGCQQSDFPSQTDRLLLGVAANQAAMVLQHMRSETALRRQSALLHAERELWRVTLASIGDAVVTTDAQERVRFLNAVAESLTGWTAAEATGRPLSQVFKIVNERTRQPVENPALRALKEGVIVGLANHTVLIARDGTERPIDDSAAPIKDTNGATIGVVLIFRDVTEQRQAEEQLRRSEQELTDFFENATIELHWVGPDGTILRANQAELDLLGYSREEYVGCSIADFHADEEVIGDILRRLHAGEQLHDYPARMRCQDGSIREVLIDSSVLWEAGRFVHTRCFTRDITEKNRAERALRESEERFRFLAEMIPSVVWTAAPDGTITYVNEQWLKFCGLTPEQNARNWPQLVLHPDDHQRCVEQWTRALHEGTEYEIEVRNRRHDGVYRWFVTRAVPLKEAGFDQHMTKPVEFEALMKLLSALRPSPA
jgi:PAS domain S-box-containing protein